VSTQGRGARDLMAASICLFEFPDNGSDFFWFCLLAYLLPTAATKIHEFPIYAEIFYWFCRLNWLPNAPLLSKFRYC